GMKLGLRHLLFGHNGSFAVPGRVVRRYCASYRCRDSGSELVKSSSRAGARPARAGVRGGVLGVAALLVGISSAVLIPGTAAAAEIDAITGVQMDGDPSVPLHVFDKFTIRAT